MSQDSPARLAVCSPFAFPPLQEGNDWCTILRRTMRIGIPKEIRPCECRVSLIPADVAQLVEAGHELHVQKTAGVASGYLPGEYEKAGARISDEAHSCDLLVGVKAPALALLKDAATVMAYLHVEKGRNPKLLAELRSKSILSYAFEEIRNGNSDRVVNLGFEAGVVGIAEGLRILGEILEKAGKPNPFKTLKHVREYGFEKHIYSAIGDLGAINEINIVIMGKGCVSRGVRDLLGKTNIKPTVLCRKRTAEIEKYLPDVDILVNAVDWYPHESRILKKHMLTLMKQTALIVDISCDRNGAVETCIPTKWADPIYEAEGITHFCVSTLPSAIPRDSSIRLSRMILPHVMKVANGEELSSGMITRDGDFVYQALPA